MLSVERILRNVGQFQPEGLHYHLPLSIWTILLDRLSKEGCQCYQLEGYFEMLDSLVIIYVGREDIKVKLS